MNRGRWLVLVVVSAATALLLLDVTVVYVALPAIQSGLGSGFGAMQWVIDAYALTLAATLLGAGVLADRFGRVRVFVTGLLLFSLFSVVCGLAGSALTLNLARGAQGVGAAAMFAASLAILAEEFPARERGFALGVWGAVTGAAMAVGPLIGGLMVDGLGWRSIFLLNVPVGLLLVVAAIRLVPESGRGVRGRPDLPGMLLFVAAGLLVVFGLTRGNEEGWGSSLIVVSLVGAALLTAAFVVVEIRHPDPMLDLRHFRSRPFTGTAIIAFAQSVAIYPLLFFLAIHFQVALGYGPTATGLRLLPLTLMILLVAPLSGRLTGRLPLRIPLVTGLLLLGLGLTLMRMVEPGDPWTVLLPGMLVGGIAIGLISPALAAAMVSVLPVEESGLSSGVNNTFRQLGIAFGVAGLGVLFAYHPGVSGAVEIVAGLRSVALVAAGVAAAGAALGWWLLGRHMATAESPDPER